MFSRTLREAPNGADCKGYEYLLRAGYIRQLGAGIFSLLPLGFKATTKIETIIREEMDKIGASTLVTRMTSDINQVQNGVNLVLRLFLRSPFIVFGAMIMAFTIDYKAALVFVAAIPILALIVFGIMLSTRPMYKNVQAGLDKILGITRENLTGVRVIRAFNMEDEEIGRFKEANQNLNKLQKFVGKISGLMNPLTYVVVNVSIIALIWIGALRVNLGTLSQGQVVALYNYMSQILVELIKLANLVISITKALACSGRIDTVFQVQSGMEYGIIKATYGFVDNTPAVEFKNVSLKYSGGGDNALTGISFSVMPGETVGVIGGTGSGKTSLVSLIPRFYDATVGEVLINGINVKEYTEASLKKKVAVVMQKAILFKGTIRDNMKWGDADASDDDILEALRVSQSLEFVEKKRGRLDAFIDQQGKNLSGGQKQRLNIARALVRKPDILILDDSASALDYATDAALRNAISNLNPAPTLFIVSQRAASLMHADKIIVLDDGEMVGIGTHEELLAGCEVYQEIYNSQFKQE